MITLSFTEEDRTLLLNLSSIQRDRVFFALLAGGEAAEYRDMGHIQHLMDTIQTASERNGLLEIQEIKVYDF